MVIARCRQLQDSAVQYSAFMFLENGETQITALYKRITTFIVTTFTTSSDQKEKNLTSTKSKSLKILIKNHIDFLRSFKQ